MGIIAVALVTSTSMWMSSIKSDIAVLQGSVVRRDEVSSLRTDVELIRGIQAQRGERVTRLEADNQAIKDTLNGIRSELKELNIFLGSKHPKP